MVCVFSVCLLLFRGEPKQVGQQIWILVWKPECHIRIDIDTNEYIRIKERYEYDMKERLYMNIQIFATICQNMIWYDQISK